MKPTQTIQQQVIEFHQAMDQPIAPYPQIIADDRVRLRAKLIAEEFFETMRAMFLDDSMVEAEEAVRLTIEFAPVRVDLVELVDGLADLAYVIEGTHLELGVDSQSIAEEVHRSNMAKVGGPTSPEGKKLKPEGWTPPKIAQLLEMQKNWCILGEIVRDGP